MAKVKRNPRIIVAFKPPQYELIAKLAELESVPMSEVIRQLFTQVEPMLRDVAVALEAAKQAQGQPAAQLIAAMSRLQATVQASVEHAVQQGDMFSGQMGRTVKRLQKRAGRRKEKPAGKRKRALSK